MLIPAIAFVVRGTARARLANIYQARAREGDSGFQIEVFPDPEAARAWLKEQGAA